MAIKIITDTSCDLGESVLMQYDVRTIPLIIIGEDREYLENIDIKPMDIYKNMRDGKAYKTAQLSLHSMEKEFSKVLENGDDLIFISLSSRISGTYNNANIIADGLRSNFPDRKVVIWDSKGTSAGLGIMVNDIAKAAYEGKSHEELIDMLKFYTAHMQYILTVDDISYLHRGGRVTGLEKIIGNILHIKPVLHFDKEGNLVQFAKVRGKMQSHNKLLEMFVERIGNSEELKDVKVYVSHADSREDAEKIYRKLLDRYGIKKCEIVTLGAAVGVHTGPGFLGLFFLDQNYKKFGDGAVITDKDYKK